MNIRQFDYDFIRFSISPPPIVMSAIGAANILIEDYNKDRTLPRYIDILCLKLRTALAVEFYLSCVCTSEQCWILTSKSCNSSEFILDQFRAYCEEYPQACPAMQLANSIIRQHNDFRVDDKSFLLPFEQLIGQKLAMLGI